MSVLIHCLLSGFYHQINRTRECAMYRALLFVRKDIYFYLFLSLVLFSLLHFAFSSICFLCSRQKAQRPLFPFLFLNLV